MEEFMNYG